MLTHLLTRTGHLTRCGLDPRPVVAGVVDALATTTDPRLVTCAFCTGAGFRTPAATCEAGHRHLSRYEATRCDRQAPAVPTSYPVLLGWHGFGRRA